MLQPRISEKKAIWYFTAAWILINLLQAWLVDVDGDEAYYWMYAQDLRWGYFDHPPMVALLIRLGELFGHGSLFTRLCSVVLFGCSIPLIFYSLPEQLRRIRLYIVLFSATLLFHVYGFITTPDAPLFFFTCLFFYAYKQYLEKSSWKETLLLTIAVSGLFYSKYHGILPVFFVVLSNPRLLLKGSFWGMVITVCLIYTPHLYWQYQHDWPTLRYHLLERTSTDWKPAYTSGYIISQLLIWGPLISLFFYCFIFKIKSTSLWMRAQVFNLVGILILFFISSFKNRVEAHWTLVAGVSFVALFLQLLDGFSEKRVKLFTRLAFVNIGIILLARILLIIPGTPFEKVKNYKPFFYARAWADTINNKSNGQPIVFVNSYIYPALYRYYYPQTEVIGYNTKHYRKTQYSIVPATCSFDGKFAWLFYETPLDKGIDVSTPLREAALFPDSAFTYITGLKIDVLNYSEEMAANARTPVTITISNTSNHIIDTRGRVKIDYSFVEKRDKLADGKEQLALPELVLPPGYKKTIDWSIIAPEQQGKYRLLFSLTNGKIEGNFGSSFYPVSVR